MASVQNDYLFKEPSYLTLCKGPYYKPWHLRYQKKFRQFIDQHMMPFADQWDESGNVPSSISKKCYQQGFFSESYPPKYGGQLFENKYSLDAFGQIIKGYELHRLGASGIQTTIWEVVIQNLTLSTLRSNPLQTTRNRL
eukprot:497905_1